VLPAQQIVKDTGQFLQVYDAIGQCNGQIVKPGIPPTPCVCKVTIKSGGSPASPVVAAAQSLAAAPTQAGESKRTPLDTKTELVVRLHLPLAEAQTNEDHFRLQAPGCDQTRSPKANAVEDGRHVLLSFGECARFKDECTLRIEQEADYDGKRETIPHVFVLPLNKTLRSAAPVGANVMPSFRPTMAPLELEVTGCGYYSVNRFRIWFRPRPHWRITPTIATQALPGKIRKRLDARQKMPSLTDLVLDFTDNFDVYFNGGVRGIGHCDGKPLPQRVEWQKEDRHFWRQNVAKVLRHSFGCQAGLGFQLDLRLFGWDFWDIHVDWVGRIWHDAQRGFAVQTLRRFDPDWSFCTIEKIVGVFRKKFRLNPANEHLMLARLMVLINEHHFLSGRRSWIIQPDPEVPGTYFLESAALERYTGHVHRWLTGNPPSRVLMWKMKSIREVIDRIWCTLLMNYVRANGYEEIRRARAPGWEDSLSTPVICKSEGAFRDPAHLQSIGWVRETLKAHPTLAEQLRPQDRILPPPNGKALPAGVYVAARDLSAAEFEPENATFFWPGRHQFLVLIPAVPGQFPDVRKIGDETRGLIIGGHVDKGHLVARSFQESDLRAIQEFTNPAKFVRFYRPDFDTEVHRVDLSNSARSIDETIAAILKAIRAYQRHTARTPIRYPAKWELVKRGIGDVAGNLTLGVPLKSRLMNSNSWAQSVVEFTIGYGRVIENMNGNDILHDTRIPPMYFSSAE